MRCGFNHSYPRVNGQSNLDLNRIIIDSVKIGENPQHGYTKEFLIKRKKYQTKLSHENFKPKKEHMFTNLGE
jgi:hypothetical protein